MNKKIIAISVLIAVLFVGAFAGMIFYYNGEIANLNSQISNFKGQLTNLTGQLTNLTGKVNSANLVTELTVTEVPYNYNYTGTYSTLNYVYIWGYVTNTGLATAYNAGLHVVAYTATGTLEINMNVPLGIGGYGEGINNSTHGIGTSYGPSGGFSSDLADYSSPITQAVSNENVGVYIAIYHEGTVANWTVTPVWTNSP